MESMVAGRVDAAGAGGVQAEGLHAATTSKNVHPLDRRLWEGPTDKADVGAGISVAVLRPSAWAIVKAVVLCAARTS